MNNKTAEAMQLLVQAEAEIGAISMAEDRAAYAGLEPPRTIGDYMAWLVDEIEIQQATPAGDPHYQEAFEYALQMRALVARLRRLGFTPAPSPFAYPRVRLDYSGDRLANIYLDIQGEEGAGKIHLLLGGYGLYVILPEIASQPVALLDLFHNSPAAEQARTEDDELDEAEKIAGAPCKYQVILYEPTTDSTLAAAMFWPDMTLIKTDPLIDTQTTAEGAEIIGFELPKE